MGRQIGLDKFLLFMLAFWDYAYRHKDCSIISDQDYDAICKFALENYDKIPETCFKRTITRDMLATGSIEITGGWPLAVVAAFEELFEKYQLSGFPE